MKTITYDEAIAHLSQRLTEKDAEIERLQARIAEAIGLLENEAKVVDSGKVQALIVLEAAEVKGK